MPKIPLPVKSHHVSHFGEPHHPPSHFRPISEKHLPHGELGVQEFLATLQYSAGSGIQANPLGAGAPIDQSFSYTVLRQE